MSTAKTELRRFLTITGQRFKTGQSAPEKFSPAIDKAWHDLLGTPAYEALCLKTARQPIRHVANNGHGPIAWHRRRPLHPPRPRTRHAPRAWKPTAWA
ncbi:hypothetical protein PUR34_02470 [Streptomyces sp. JV185]|uniref:hypothetical protein n=1 Tax=Streptomyces sp. JV185 TaxID=858638 RepID=UPI002E79D396|nr:hypothetical protein [Streptomyces sp. JV185]MEE1767079.1 hypothetical protein [Streptomyces sp. JV185]